MTTAKNDVLLDYDSKIFCWEVDKNLVGERSLLGWREFFQVGWGIEQIFDWCGGTLLIPPSRENPGYSWWLKGKK